MMRRIVLSPSAMAQAGWTRIDARPWRKTTARWRHVDGWRLEHCGHPTALWPWALYDAGGTMHVARNGRAWPDLASAVAYAAAGAPTVPVCPGRVRSAWLFDGCRVERPEDPPAPAAVRVALVGCGKAKRAGTHPAAELYCGSLFRAALEEATRTSDRVFIVSAKHGLLYPDSEIEAYEQRLEARDVDAWAGGVLEDLAGELAGARAHVVILAGRDYAAPLAAPLRARGCIVETPLDGLELGARLQWFKARRVARFAARQLPLEL